MKTIRRGNRGLSPSVDLEEIAAEDREDFDKVFHEELLRKAIDHAKGKVSEQDFQIFMLRKVMGISANDVAKQFAKSSAAIDAITHRVKNVCRAKFKALLEEYD